MRFVAGLLLVEAASAIIISSTYHLGRVEPAARAIFERLLTASELLDDDGKVRLSAADLRTALEDMHLQKEISTPEPSLVHPSTLLPIFFYENESVDVTSLVCNELPLVLEALPSFAFMVEQTLGNERFHESVYFGIVPRDEHSLSFSALCRRLVASIVLFEALLALDHDGHRLIARWYEALYARAVERQKASTAGRSRPHSARDALMGFFLALKGESVLASINAFEELRRLNARGGATGAAMAALSDVLNDIMRLNICEAVLSNLSFAYWPDNARAGMALLLAPLGRFRPDLTQEADLEWTRLYLAWNANFIWPSHYCPDMMCFTMLAMPSIALGSPEAFQYRRAHSLFWVVRSTQARIAGRRWPLMTATDECSTDAGP